MTTYADPTVPYRTRDLLYLGDPTPPMLLVIAGERYDDSYVPGSLRIADLVEERSAMKLRIEDGGAALHFQQGQSVKLRINGQLLFDGVVLDPTEMPAGPFGLLHDLDCTDWHYLTDRRTITRAFVGTTAGQAVRDIITEFLAEDDISFGTIEDGPAISEVVFSYVSATRAIARLAEEADFTWRLRPDKRLDFHRRTVEEAPVVLNGIDDYAERVRVEHRNRDYRNRQIIRGGKAETDSQIERYTGDGEQRTFVVGFPIARQPTVTVNSVAQIVGVKGISDDDPTVQWRWARGSAELTQDQTEVRLVGTDVLEVTYLGLFELVMIATDQAEVVGRQEVEGFGTGRIDHVETDPEITTVAAASARAAHLLARYARIGRRLKFATEDEWPVPGQLLRGSIPLHGIVDGEFLIYQVGTSNPVPGTILREVVAVEGPVEGSWARFFLRLAERADPLQFRENISEEETVVILESRVEQTAWTETLASLTFACIVPSATLDAYAEPTIGYRAAGVDYAGRQAWLVIPGTTTTYAPLGLGYADAGTRYNGNTTGDLIPC